MISFYRLAPGKSVKEHSGGDNQRLKCHLVIRAPVLDSANAAGGSGEGGEGGDGGEGGGGGGGGVVDPGAAYIQVSDTKRIYATGYVNRFLNRIC